MTQQDLVIVETPSQELQAIINSAFDFKEAATSKNTKIAYAYAAKSFLEWCSSKNVDPLAVSEKDALVALYASDKARNGKLKASSISSYIAGICSWFKERGFKVSMSSEPIAQVLTGINNLLGTRPNKKEPIVTEDLKDVLQGIPIERDGVPVLAGIRDRAIILLGFAGAFRRSELVGLNVEDIKDRRNGFIVLVRKSKTDQARKGLRKKIAYGSSPLTCPVRAVQDWLKASQITSGPLFRAINRHGQMSNEPLTGRSVALIIQRNPYFKGREAQFAGHSLRRGWITSAAKRKIPEALAMAHTGHTSIPEYRGYISDSDDFDDAASAMVGL